MTDSQSKQAAVEQQYKIKIVPRAEFENTQQAFLDTIGSVLDNLPCFNGYYDARHYAVGPSIANALPEGYSAFQGLKIEFETHLKDPERAAALLREAFAGRIPVGVKGKNLTFDFTGESTNMTPDEIEVRVKGARRYVGAVANMDRALNPESEHGKLLARMEEQAGLRPSAEPKGRTEEQDREARQQFLVRVQELLGKKDVTVLTGGFGKPASEGDIFYTPDYDASLQIRRPFEDLSYTQERLQAVLGRHFSVVVKNGALEIDCGRVKDGAGAEAFLQRLEEYKDRVREIVLYEPSPGSLPTPDQKQSPAPQKKRAGLKAAKPSAQPAPEPDSGSEGDVLGGKPAAGTSPFLPEHFQSASAAQSQASAQQSASRRSMDPPGDSDEADMRWRRWCNHFPHVHVHKDMVLDVQYDDTIGRFSSQVIRGDDGHNITVDGFDPRTHRMTWAGKNDVDDDYEMSLHDAKVCVEMAKKEIGDVVEAEGSDVTRNRLWVAVQLQNLEDVKQQQPTDSMTMKNHHPRLDAPEMTELRKALQAAPQLARQGFWQKADAETRRIFSGLGLKADGSMGSQQPQKKRAGLKPPSAAPV